MTPIEPLVKLIEMVLVVTTVVGYLVLYTRWFRDILARRFSLRSQFVAIVVFGAFSVYGTYSGIIVREAMVNIRDLGPMVAGLVAGPLVGLGAGLIGGIHRYSLGGFTGLSCSLATVLAGLLGGIVFSAKKSRLPSLSESVVFSVGIESLHMLLVLLLARPYSEAVTVVQEVVLPMMVANGLGMAIFILIFSYEMKTIEKEKESEMCCTEHTPTVAGGASKIPRHTDTTV